MNARERAEKIADKFSSHCGLGKEHKHCSMSELRSQIASAIEEAEREALKNSPAYDEGWFDAIEASAAKARSLFPTIRKDFPNLPNAMDIAADAILGLKGQGK